MRNLRTTDVPLRAAACLAMLLVAAAPDAGAQTSRSDPTDLQSRFGTQFRVNLPDKWLATLEVQGRMVDDISAYRGTYVSSEVERGLGKHLAVLANYRMALVDDGTYHRVGLGLEASGKLGEAKLSFRPMVQFQRQHFDGDDDFGSDDDAFVRTRAAVKYPLSERWALIGAVEPYFKLGADYPVDNWKNTLTLEYEIAKGVKVDAYYAYRPDYAKSYNRTFHIVGTEMEIEVKWPKKAKAAKEGA
ncbi:MAG: DUF2490 domain-containing protein [Gemmatimonadetes bacterium]|nr:DUF2490 domain-containing protein [Gemmatimonadota bacterium]